MIRQHIQYDLCTFEQFNPANMMEKLLVGLSKYDKIENWSKIMEQCSYFVKILPRHSDKGYG